MKIKFDELLPLYKKVCLEHTESLYYTYNSELNPNNYMTNQRKIKLYFEDNGEINAYAFVDKDDNISIELELLRNIHECISEFINNSTSSHDEDEKNIIGMYLFYIASKFLISHEFFHLYGGHCDLLNALSTRTIKLGIEYSDAYGLSPLDYQTMEMNADCGAICRTVDTMLFRHFYHDVVLSLIHDKENAIEYALFALDIIFFVLRDKKLPIYDIIYQEREHHPLLMRQIMNQNTFMKYIHIEHGVKLTNDYLTQSFVKSELILNNLEGSHFSGVESYVKNLNDEHISHEKKLRNNVNAINNKLSSYIRTPYAEFA